MDLHHNLFYGYRGPNTDDADRDRQLENNLTKALINTLKLGGETVWRPFLAELGLAGAPHDFLLQRHNVPGYAKNRRHRVLLGISKQKSTWSPGAAQRQHMTVFLMRGCMGMGLPFLWKAK